MKSATTASTEIPQPAIAIPVCPVGTNTEAIPRLAGLAVELERDGHLPDRAVRADGEHGLAGQLEVRAGRHIEVGRRPPQIGQRDAGRRARAPTISGSSARNWCRPFSMSSPFRMQSRSRSRQAGGKRPPCVATPTRAVVGSQRQGRGDVRDDRHTLLRLPRTRRVEDRDDVLAAVAQHPAHRLAVVRVAGEALGENQEPSRRASRHRDRAPRTAPGRRR